MKLLEIHDISGLLWHDFPTIQNKIQVKDDDNDLSIWKKFDKSSESERKGSYEKVSLEQEQYYIQ